MLFAIAQSVSAQDDQTSGIPPRPADPDTKTSRQANERWERLKTQYFSPGSRTELPSIRGDQKNLEPGGGDASSLGISPLFDPETGKSKGWTSARKPKKLPTSSELSVMPNSNRANSNATRPNPFADDSAEWDKGRVAARPAESKPAADAALPMPEEPAQNAPVNELGDGSRKVYLSKTGVRHVTQVRLMRDIVPTTDLDADQDIRSFAKARRDDLNIITDDTATNQETSPFRSFAPAGVFWNPPHAQYYQLYFQDPQMERYGQTFHPLIQPIVSNLRFGTQLFFLPYQMAINPPWELQTGLGWYRPGDVAPRLIYQPPLSAKAAIVEAATVTGICFLIP